MKTNKLLISSILLIAPISSYAQTGIEPPWHEDFNEPGFVEPGIDSPESPVAVTDGNPQSTTSAAAMETAIDTAIVTPSFITEEFTSESTESPEGEASETASAQTAAEASAQSNSAQLDIDIGMGSSTVNGIDIDYFTVRIPYSYTFNKRDSINISIPVSITNIKDILTTVDSNGVASLSNAQIFGGGLNASYSRKVFIKDDGKPYRWKVSPSTGIFLRESTDLNQGSWVYNVGLSSSFAYQVKKNWIINLGNSISYSWNSGRKDYPDPLREEQQTLVNGLQVFYLAGRWTYYGYVIDTRFLKDSLVDSYQTYALGAGFQLTQKRSLKLTILYDDGNGYESFRANLGTSWKF